LVHHGHSNLIKVLIDHYQVCWVLIQLDRLRWLKPLLCPTGCNMETQWQANRRSFWFGSRTCFPFWKSSQKMAIKLS
jgi:hypothetical protein